MMDGFGHGSKSNQRNPRRQRHGRQRYLSNFFQREFFHTSANDRQEMVEVGRRCRKVGFRPENTFAEPTFTCHYKQLRNADNLVGPYRIENRLFSSLG